eukprot:scaffold26796_cov30-Tisochrysis_lutea.AAC.1
MIHLYTLWHNIKTKGSKSFPLAINSGVPQGCPLSPLAFLLTVEALTRAINNDDTINGIIINGAELKKSQFADDTVESSVAGGL